MAGIFDGLGKAEVFEKGSFLNPGYYVVAVQRVMAKKSRESGVGVIGELDILQSTFRPQVDPKNQGRTWQNTPAGVPGTWWQGMEIDGALGSIKGFMRAMLGLRVASHPNECAELESYPPGLVDRYGRPVNMGENLMNLVVSQENVFCGFLVNLECFIIETQRRKSDFTVYQWSPLDFASFGVPPPPTRMLLDRARSTYFPPPDTDHREQPPALQGPPPGYGPAFGPPPGPGAYGAPPAPPWGQPALPPAPPAYGPPAPAWRSGPTVPQAWGPPPPAALPPVPPPWTPPPGSSFSQDGIWYAPPGGQWARIPGR